MHVRFKLSLYKNLTLNVIPAFRVTPKVRMWGLGFLYEDPTLNAIPAFGVTPNSYHVHFPTLISIAPTLVPYLLSPTDTATLIISYPTNLAIVLTTYPTNLAILLITYPINLTIRFRVETHKLINKFFTNV
jgi:hypothetical protein